jgi:hypothetical protein
MLFSLQKKIFKKKEYLFDIRNMLQYDVTMTVTVTQEVQNENLHSKRNSRDLTKKWR